MELYNYVVTVKEERLSRSIRRVYVITWRFINRVVRISEELTQEAAVL